MLKLYYNPKYKYSNRTIIDLTGDNDFESVDYVNIDSPDTINGHIIYVLGTNGKIPTYVYDTTLNRKWFVSGISQLNSGKYQISLLRDVISESDDWKGEEAYINAGLAPSNNYNKYKVWGLPFTNTKVRQEKLTINGKPSFFVFYVNEQHINSGNITEDDLKLKSTLLPGISQPDFTVSELSEIPSYEYIEAGNVLKLASGVSYDIRTFMYKNGGTIIGAPNKALVTWSGIGNSINTNPIVQSSGPISSNDSYLLENVSVDSAKNNTNNCLSDLGNACNNFWNTYKNNLGTLINQSDINNLNSYIDKNIYVTSTQKVYRLRLTTSNQTLSGKINNSQSSTLISAIRNINWPIVGGSDSWTTEGNYFFSYSINSTTYNYTLEELGTAVSCDFNFKSNQRKLPKSAVRCVNIVSDNNISDEELSQTLMIMQANAGNIDKTGRIVDIQYLPFSVADTTDNNIKVNNNPMIAKFLDVDNFYYQTSLPTITNINKETDTIKIVSPSRASQFLFKPYNNDGNLTFDSKITIKPYTSIIYIRPQTTGLLINNWDDKDCLIISEDMSLTQLSSEWANYVYNNRNYQNAFNRTIQGREFERSWERRVEQANMKSEEWNARNISAQKARTYTGNIPIISDIAGAIGSAWKDSGYMQAVQTDLAYNQAMHEEAINLARDQFNYQIENLQSQPVVPSSITTIDTKLLDGVYLEFYSTNPTELSAIENYYKYNGNRIDDYGTFNDYYGPFVRGKIIKSQNYTQPEINEINTRLGMGIFTGE